LTLAVVGVGRLVKPLKMGDFQGPTVYLPEGISKTLQIPLPWQVRKTTFWDPYGVSIRLMTQLGRHQGAISA